MTKKISVVGLFNDGNAYAILAKCSRAARKAGWSEEQWEKFSLKAKAGDYDHLLQTVMRSFDETEED